MTFSLRAEDLAVWDSHRQWTVEPGGYTVFVGGSSQAAESAHFDLPAPAPVALGADPDPSDRWINAPLLSIEGRTGTDYSAAYQLAVRVLEYNLRGGLLEAGEGYGTWTRDTAINSWNAASLLLPEISQQTLWHETEASSDGPIVSGQFWDKVIWIIAARHQALVTGDRAFLREAYGTAVRTLEEMRRRQFDAADGLFRGPAVYGDGVAAYPNPPFDDQRGDNVRDYAEAGQIEVLSTNSVYYGAYRAAAEMGRLLNAPAAETAALDRAAEDLRAAIQHNLWLPPEHRFAYFRDGAGHTDATQEGLGEALAILLGVADEAQAQQIFVHAEETPWGIACTWPPFARYSDATLTSFGRHNGTIWPFINAFWATAAAQSGDSQAFAREFRDITALALRSGDFREIYHPYSGKPYGGVQTGTTWDSVRHQTWSASGYLRMIYSGLMGMRFEENGLRFEPMIPRALGIRRLTLHDLAYRKVTVTVTIAGSGRRIGRILLDGREVQAAFVPASLEGAHSMEIQLASERDAERKPIGAKVAPSRVNAVAR